VPHPAGAIGLTHIGGRLGAAIRVGQLLNGAAPRHARWTHALIAVGDGTIVQAEPGGAQRVTEAAACAGREVLWFFPDGTTPGQRQVAARAATDLTGAPYSFADYAALAAVRLHLDLVAHGLRDYVAASGRLICSQLVDEAYRRAGVDLIPGRRPGDVTPADLARLAIP